MAIAHSLPAASTVRIDRAGYKSCPEHVHRVKSAQNGGCFRGGQDGCGYLQYVGMVCLTGGGRLHHGLSQVGAILLL